MKLAESLSNSFEQPIEISRTPSREIQQLASIDPAIFSSANGRLTCKNSAINFIGSLVLALEKQEVTRAYTSVSLPIPDIVTTSGYLATDVPILWHNPRTHAYEDCQMKAQTVWVKRSCGSRVGIVLQGSLSGLILEPANGCFANEGMCFGMVYPDKPIGGAKPYQVLMSNYYIREAYARVEQIADIELLRPYIDGSYIDQAIEDAQEKWRSRWIEEKSAHTSLVDFTFYLCKKLGLPLDKKAFHYTRSLQN